MSFPLNLLNEKVSRAMFPNWDGSTPDSLVNEHQAPTASDFKQVTDELLAHQSAFPVTTISQYAILGESGGNEGTLNLNKTIFNQNGLKGLYLLSGTANFTPREPFALYNIAMFAINVSLLGSYPVNIPAFAFDELNSVFVQVVVSLTTSNNILALIIERPDGQPFAQDAEYSLSLPLLKFVLI
jgi:hypothetical protein